MPVRESKKFPAKTRPKQNGLIILFFFVYLFLHLCFFFASSPLRQNLYKSISDTYFSFILTAINIYKQIYSHVSPKQLDSRYCPEFYNSLLMQGLVKELF